MLLTFGFDPFSYGAWMFYLCATMLYFVSAYKMGAKNKLFSMGYWIKDNALNVVTSVIMFVGYNFMCQYGKEESIRANASAIVIIALGASIVMGLIQKRISKFRKRQ